MGEQYGSSGSKRAGAVEGFEKVKRYPMREENLWLILAGAVCTTARFEKLGYIQSKAELTTAQNEREP